MSNEIFTAIFMAMLGALFGWFVAHAEIATECQRQGSFYVGKTDFVCGVKK